MKYIHPAIVLDAELLAPLCVIQTLGKKGVPVTAVSHDRNAIGFTSRYPRKRLLSDVPVNSASFIDFLVSQKERGVLICGRDYTAEVLARHKDRLINEGFLLRTPNLDDQLRCYDKFSLHQLTRSMGIRYPKSILLESEEALYTLETEISFPFILKPTKADSGLYYLVKHPSDNPLMMYRELKGILKDQKFMHANSQIIAQEFLSADNIQLWNYNALYDKGYATAEFTGLRLRSPVKPDGTLSSTLLFGKSKENEELKILNRKFLGAIPYEGIVETEWAYSPIEKEYVLFDVNTRISGNIRWAIQGGVDLPHLYYLLCTEGIKEIPKQTENTTYHKIFWFNSDLLHAFRSVVSDESHTPGTGSMKSRLKKLLMDRSMVMKKASSSGQHASSQKKTRLSKVIRSNLFALLTPHKSAIDVLDFEDITPTFIILKRLMSLLTHRIVKKKTGHENISVL